MNKFVVLVPFNDFDDELHIGTVGVFDDGELADEFRDKILTELKSYYDSFHVNFFGYNVTKKTKKPFIVKNFKENYTEEELMDYYAIGQSTPGIIAINIATLMGYKKRKLLGALVATFGIILPSWIIIMSIASFFNEFTQNIYVQKAFSGVRVAVVVLILNAVIRMGKKAITDNIGIIICVISFCLIAFLSVSPIIIIVASGITGVIIKSISIKESSENK